MLKLKSKHVTHRKHGRAICFLVGSIFGFTAANYHEKSRWRLFTSSESPDLWLSGLSQRATSSESTELAIVIPFQANSILRIRKSVLSWKKACNAVDMTSNSTDLIFFSSHLIASSRKSLSLLAQTIQSSESRACFHNTRFLDANIPEIEDTYPKGINLMFFKLLIPSLRPDISEYGHIFWMEHDVVPIRENWLSLLRREASNDFMIKGSICKSDVLDKWIQRDTGRAWYSHINGNALYNLQDDCLHALVNITVQEYLDPQIPFDVALAKALYHWVEGDIRAWRFYQNCMTKYAFSDFIQNFVGSGVTSTPPETIFIHGTVDSTELLYQ